MIKRFDERSALGHLLPHAETSTQMQERAATLMHGVEQYIADHQAQPYCGLDGRSGTRMAYEATLNENGHHSVHDLKMHLRGMARDVGQMAELQAKLFFADLEQAHAGLVLAACCWLAALVLSLALLPVLVAGVGIFLSDVTRLTVAGGLLVAAAGAAAIVVGLAVGGWVQLRRQRVAWEESKAELRNNLHALRRRLARIRARRRRQTAAIDLISGFC